MTESPKRTLFPSVPCLERCLNHLSNVGEEPCAHSVSKFVHNNYHPSSHIWNSGSLTNSRLNTLNFGQEDNDEKKVQNEENHSVGEGNKVANLTLAAVNLLKSQLLAKHDSISSLDNEMLKKDEFLDIRVKMLQLENENKSLKLENQKLKSDLSEWSPWYEELKKSLESLPTIEEFNEKIKKDNQMMKMLISSEKKLKKARQIILKLNEAKRDLERKLKEQENLSGKSSDCCSYCCPVKLNRSNVKSELDNVSTWPKQSQTELNTSQKQTETELSHKSTHEDSTKRSNSETVFEYKTEPSCPNSSEENHLQYCSEVLSSEEISKETTPKNDVGELTRNLIRRMKEGGITKQQYCMQLKWQKETALFDLKKFETNEFILRNDLLETRAQFCQIQDQIDKLRCGKDSKSVTELIRRQNQLAHNIDIMEDELIDCSAQKSDLLKMFIRIKKFLEFVSNVDC